MFASVAAYEKEQVCHFHYTSKVAEVSITDQFLLYLSKSHALLISGKYHLLNDTAYSCKKLYMCVLKPIQVETKNNLSFEISQDWFFPNVHWTLFWDVADFKNDPYPLSITHHMWQVWEEGSLLYMRFAHGSGENLETQPGWLAEDNIWAGS